MMIYTGKSWFQIVPVGVAFVFSLVISKRKVTSTRFIDYLPEFGFSIPYSDCHVYARYNKETILHLP